MIWCLVCIHYLFLLLVMSWIFWCFGFCCSKLNSSDFELVVRNVPRGG